LAADAPGGCQQVAGTLLARHFGVTENPTQHLATQSGLIGATAGSVIHGHAFAFAIFLASSTNGGVSFNAKRFARLAVVTRPSWTFPA
jgi:hypothetical protein